MKMIKRYAGILMMLTLLVGFTSCESEEETEFNLPGEWYTNEEIEGQRIFLVGKLSFKRIA